MKNLIAQIQTKPVLYQQSQANIWTDPYLSQKMLEAHLDEASDGATRRKDFVRQSAAWIASQLPPDQYPQLLDLGCGPGIYAELFARQGYQVSGIDFSVRSLNYAKQSAAEKGLAIQYRQGDYTRIEFGGPFHLITLIYCDFGVLTPSARTALLKQIYASLLPGGAFLFDVFTPLNYKDKPESRRWFVEEQGYWSEEPALVLHAFYRYDQDTSYCNQYVTIKPNAYTVYHVWEHGFTAAELERDLTAAGFRSVTFYGDVAGGALDKDGTTLCVLAKK